MDYGVLSSYFDGAVAKRLVAVDIDGKVSNQHEFNGTAELRSLFGDNDIRGIPRPLLICATMLARCLTMASQLGMTPAGSILLGLNTGFTTMTMMQLRPLISTT